MILAGNVVLFRIYVDLLNTVKFTGIVAFGNLGILRSNQ
ncbi:hypothetical protein NIES4101_47050 [Calothrix sp. NIES-4101]|nr:hypothetical protein NIES4101_47050 [Calothrix sp. NIES-4101]